MIPSNYTDHFDIDPKLVNIGLSLVASGKSNQNRYYTKHSMKSNATTVALEVTCPRESRSGNITNGSIKLLNSSNVAEFQTDSTMKAWPVIEYLSHKVYIDPKLMDIEPRGQRIVVMMMICYKRGAIVKYHTS